jgi:threonine/homoserine/homoserine lactone efflux protein
MPPYLLIKGIALGFAIAAPVGPIGLLCIRRTLAHGRLVGLLTGLGAASADAVYAAVAAFGLTSFSQFLIGQQLLVRLIGGVFLCYLGVRTFLTEPQSEMSDSGRTGLTGAFTSTFFLTLTNPLTILSFAAVFAGLGVTAQDEGYLAASVLVAGVFLGSALWWLLLSGGVSLLRSRFDRAAMRWVNRGAGLLLFLIGLAALVAAAPA